VRPPTEHFKRLLLEAYPNHTYPIRCKLKDSDMMRSYMTSGSITSGVELIEGPDMSDMTPFPEENTVMMVYGGRLTYPIFIPKPSTHRMHDPGSIVPHIRPKVFTDSQMSQIKYNYYINSVSKDYDDSQRNGTAEDSITPQEQQPGQHVA
jgi:hypothetical protein